MSLKYGRPTPPEDFMIGALIPLGLPVAPERDELTGLPGYVVTVLPGHDDRYVACPVVSVHSFGNTRDEADKAAQTAHNHLISLTPGDPITLATGEVVPGAWIRPKSGLPAYADYGDPFIKRYVARYEPALRYH